MDTLPNLMENHTLPIFSEEDGYYSLLISEGDKTPVLIGNHKIGFPSLTVLMQSKLNC